MSSPKQLHAWEGWRKGRARGDGNRSVWCQVREACVRHGDGMVLCGARCMSAHVGRMGGAGSGLGEARGTHGACCEPGHPTPPLAHGYDDSTWCSVGGSTGAGRWGCGRRFSRYGTPATAPPSPFPVCCCILSEPPAPLSDSTPPRCSSTSSRRGWRGWPSTKVS